MYAVSSGMIVLSYMSPAHYMAEYVHIWYILCAPARDFACAFVCTLATAKQHTKERRTITAEKQNFLCFLCRAERRKKKKKKKKKKQTRNRKSRVCVAAKATAVLSSLCCFAVPLPLLFDLRLDLCLDLRLKTKIVLIFVLISVLSRRRSSS